MINFVMVHLFHLVAHLQFGLTLLQSIKSTFTLDDPHHLTHYSSIYFDKQLFVALP